MPKSTWKKLRVWIVKEKYLLQKTEANNKKES